MLLCSMLISMAFAVYGVYTFTTDYTCMVTKFNDGLHKSCKYWMTIPSAILVMCVLCVTMYKGILLNPMI